MNKIKNIIATLDYSWFKRIKKEFEINDLYDDEVGKIFHEVEETYEDNNGEVKHQLITIDNNIEHYCWNNYILQSGCVSNLLERNKLCIAGINVFQSIFKQVNSVLKNLSYIERQKYIFSTKKAIENEFNSFIENQRAEITDKDYIESLNYIKEEGLLYFEKRYYDLLEVFDNISDEKIRLKLKLNQNETAILVRILKEANIINNDYSKKDLDYLINKLFICNNERTNKEVYPKNISKIADNLIGGYSTSSVDSAIKSVKNKLIKGIDYIEKAVSP